MYVQKNTLFAALHLQTEISIKYYIMYVNVQLLTDSAVISWLVRRSLVTIWNIST